MPRTSMSEVYAEREVWVCRDPHCEHGCNTENTEMRTMPRSLTESDFRPRVVAALDMFNRTSGNDFDRMRLALKAALEVEVCTGCGTDKPQSHYDAIPNCITCCPERDLRPLATVE